MLCWTSLEALLVRVIFAIWGRGFLCIHWTSLFLALSVGSSWGSDLCVTNCTTLLRSSSETPYWRIAAHQTCVFRWFGHTQMTTAQCLKWSALVSPCHLRLEERGDFCTHIGALIMWCNRGSRWQGRAILSTCTQGWWSLYTLCLR